MTGHPGYFDHPRNCTPACPANAIPSTLHRPYRPPMVRCTWCGAEPGVACTYPGGLGKRPMPMRGNGRCHPCRLEVAS